METDARNERTGGLVISKKALIVAGVVFLVVCLVASWFLFWKPNQPHSLLPATVTKQITDFTPYFFFDEIPGGYSLDEQSVSFDQDILIMPLTKPGRPPITLTEQTLPENLPQDIIEGEGTQKVENTAAPSIINKVEGRLVGITTSKEYRLLLIINAPGDMPAEEMTKLLQNLKPIK